MSKITSPFICFLVNCLAISLPVKALLCPLNGPVYSAPSGLSSNAKFQSVAKAFGAELNASLKSGSFDGSPAGPYNQTSFSIGMFITSEDELVYSYHYTDPSVQNGQSGTNSVDSDSVYRIGSISKAITVLIFLVQAGDKYFNNPISEFIPELSQANISSINGQLPDWSSITIGQLASHMAGLSRDYGFDELAYGWENFSGLPTIQNNQIPSCNYNNNQGDFVACDRQSYLDGVLKEPIAFGPSYTPVYSNTAFTLLALALENITGIPFEQMFTESLVDGLNLQHTTISVPNTSDNGVIPGNSSITGWQDDLGVFGPAGGYFSSTNDMAKIGRALLNYTLLSPVQTRRWMKPMAFTTDPMVSIGAPWEIFRIPYANRTLDLYTKNGGYRGYAAEWILIPDFDFGFSILTASALEPSPGGSLVYYIIDMVANMVLPELEIIAREQSNASFAGYYSSTQVNSSITIVVDDKPGLLVTQWVSNSTDLLQNYKMIAGGSDSTIEYRLQPNGLYTGCQVGFSGLWVPTSPKNGPGPLSLGCIVTWGGAEQMTVGNVGLDQFVFRVDESIGKARKVEQKALRITLDRSK